MYYAIFDTGPGFLQWIGEAADIAAAVQALRAQCGELGSDEQDPSEDFIAVYELTEAEHDKLNALIDTDEHIYQDFADEGRWLTIGEARQLAL